MKMAVMQIKKGRERPEDASHKGPVGNHLYGTEKADSKLTICLMVISGKTGAVTCGLVTGRINHPPSELQYIPLTLPQVAQLIGESRTDYFHLDTILLAQAGQERG